MKTIIFASLAVLSFSVLFGELTKDQKKYLREQSRTYGGVPEREVEYQEEVAPHDSDADHDFLMKDHPLQEKPLPRKQVE
jgi:hypothetical protein